MASKNDQAATKKNNETLPASRNSWKKKLLLTIKF